MNSYEKSYNDAADRLNQEYFNKILSIESGGHKWELSRNAVSFPYHYPHRYNSAIIRVFGKLTCEGCESAFIDLSDFDDDKDSVYDSIVACFNSDQYGSWFEGIIKGPGCNEMIIRNVIL